jgi:hypothetical protein
MRVVMKDRNSLIDQSDRCTVDVDHVHHLPGGIYLGKLEFRLRQPWKVQPSAARSEVHGRFASGAGGP